VSDIGSTDPTRIAETLDAIDAIGIRFHGTDGEARCRDYLVKRFREVGLEGVELQPFPYLAYEAGPASCRVTAPESSELPCTPLQFTAAAEAEGEAVFLGHGTGADLDRFDRMGVDLAGKVVVVHTPFPFMVTPLLEGRDVAALINVSDAPDGLVANFTACFYPPPLEPPWPGRPLAYPGATVEAEAGRRLISSTSAGTVTVRVEHGGNCVAKEAHNVVGVVPGRSRETVVVGAHYDTQAECPGIWDDATGLAATLEIARGLVGSNPQRTVVAVAFAAEEIGCYGSTVFAESRCGGPDGMAGMVNLDGLGSRLRGKRALLADEGTAEFATVCTSEMGWEPEEFFDTWLHPASDYFPFVDRGVPACQILEFPPMNPYYHTRADVRSLVDPLAVAEMATVSGGIVERFANAGGEELPVAAGAPQGMGSFFGSS
jgi:aminopeptidase YwaD